ncbi:nucleolar 5A protein [Rutstroemia sp. NJR-2017a WRK4]|nr:nucleolar 5A protein [Rutstroemia sp. NJR-2017a WRK4]
MSSPKRKRITNNPQAPTPPRSSPSHLDTSIPLPEPAPDTLQGSPRTIVAYQFQELALGGPEVRKLDFANNGQSTMTHGEPTVRKRVKISADRDVDMEESTVKEIPETPQKTHASVIIPEQGPADLILSDTEKDFQLHNEVDPVIFRAGKGRAKKIGELSRAYPSINRLADSKSRVRKRAGSPPTSAVGKGLEEREIVDPDRAAMTWHDDEITGHHPNDPDDDGEGINGIGFRPTAAIAYARAEKRKQAMADYRSREAKEARARRMERRKGDERAKANAKAEADTAARRVRFLENETPTVIFTS